MIQAAALTAFARTLGIYQFSLGVPRLGLARVEFEQISLNNPTSLCAVSNFFVIFPTSFTIY